MRPLPSIRFALSQEERAFCWRIVLSGTEACCTQCAIGNTADCDVNPLRRMPTVDDALRYLTYNGDIP